MAELFAYWKREYEAMMRYASVGVLALSLLATLLFVEAIDPATPGPRGSVLFWLVMIYSAVVLVVGYLKAPKRTDTVHAGESSLTQWPIARYAYHHLSAAYLWVPFRIAIGWDFLNAGIHKLEDPAWMVSGQGILGYWNRAVAIPAPPAKPLITFPWWREFIQFLIDSGSSVWFAKAIAIGEFAVGLGLILGVFTGVAVLFAMVMNVSFMLSGTTSTNPALLVIGVFVLLAWRVSGHVGLDRYVLPLFMRSSLGTKLSILASAAAVGIGAALYVAHVAPLLMAVVVLVGLAVLGKLVFDSRREVHPTPLRRAA